MTHVVGALEDVRQVSDAELMSRLQQLVGSERVLSTKLLVHIGEVDARGLYREAAFSSMFAYCVAKLHMSDAEALLRIYAARQGRAYPHVLEMHVQGVLHLTAIKLIGPHLTTDNHVQLLERARCKTRRELELLVAEIAPKPDVPSTLTRAKLASASATPPTLTEAIMVAKPTLVVTPAVRDSLSLPHPGTGCEADTSRSADAERPQAADAEPRKAAQVASAADSTSEANARVAAEGGSSATPRMGFALAPQPRALITPLSPGRFKLQVTLGQEAYDHLQQLRELLRHSVPSGDLAVLVERALAVLHEKTLKQRFALGTAKRSSTASLGASSIGPKTSQVAGDKEPGPLWSAQKESPSVSSPQPKAAPGAELESDQRAPAGVRSMHAAPAGAADAARKELALASSPRSEAAKGAELAAVRAGLSDSSVARSNHAAAAGGVDPTRAARKQLALASSPQSGAVVGAEPVAVRSGLSDSSIARSMRADAGGAVSARSARNEVDSARLVRADLDAQPVAAGSVRAESALQRALCAVDTQRVAEPVSAHFSKHAVCSESRSNRRSRYVPRAVVRVVYERDGGRCTFVSADGERCQARGFLELHHHGVAFALGGEASVENLRLACRAHNALWAERELGREFIYAKRGLGRDVADQRVGTSSRP